MHEDSTQRLLLEQLDGVHDVVFTTYSIRSTFPFYFTKDIDFATGTMTYFIVVGYIIVLFL